VQRATLSVPWSRYLGAGRLRSKTIKEQGLELPSEALQAVEGSLYGAGIAPYLSLLPLITDRHVNALTLAGTIEEVTEHAVVLVRAGIDEILIRPFAPEILIRPFAPEGGTIEETIANFASKVLPQVTSSF
jgi:5,10-methylenetetrahydromethanopterin reductase